MKKLQIGRSMVEMLGVLAIIGVLSVGGLYGYSVAMEKYRVNRTLDRVNLLAAQIYSLFQGSNDFSDLDVQLLIDTGIISEDECVGEDCYYMQGVFGDISMGSLWNGGFTITVYGLSPSVCVGLATGSSSSLAEGMIINHDSTYQWLRPNVGVARAEELCSATSRCYDSSGRSSDTCIVWGFSATAFKGYDDDDWY